MLEIIREITLDVSEENRFTAITAKQYDSRSRYLLVRLTDRGEALTLPDTASVLISATRPDGLSDGFEGLVQDGAALVPLDYWMLMLDGTVTCELVVTGDDGYRLTTMSFALDVRHSCFGDGLTPGGNHGVYVRLLHEIEELKKKIGEGLGGSGTVTDEQIYAAVEKYLTEHPIESPEVEKAAESARKSAEDAEASVGEAQAAADEAGESASNAGRCATAAAESASQAASSAETASSAATTATDAKESAETARSGAQAAQTAAESARDTAAQKATDATNAAQTATTAATGAAEAKTAAQTSRQAAETAKTAATNAAQTAATEAENAGKAKTDAETAKGEAQTAAMNAGKSATAASESAANAEASEEAAATSENNAAESATAAAGSATTASNAAKAAQTAQGKAETAAERAEAAAEKAGSAGGDLMYISPDGDDANDGLTVDTPKLTVKACFMAGASRISAKRGVYRQKVDISPTGGVGDVAGRNIEIFPTDNDQTYAAASHERQRIVFDTSDEIALSTFSAYNAIKSAPYTEDNYTFTRIFANGSTDGRASVWLVSSDELTVCHKLTPVLTLAEVEATVGTFYWADGTLYVNADWTGVEKVYVSNEMYNQLQFKGLSRVILREVEARLSQGYCVNIENVPHFELYACAAKFTGVTSTGLHPKNASGKMVRCYAAWCYDGLSPSGYGHTEYIDCVAEYNRDDGVSHHNGCTGTIIGGRYDHNGKYGIAPAYGARVDIYNAVCRYNGLTGTGDRGGIGYLYTTNQVPASGIVQGCVLAGNKIGLVVNANCSVVAANCHFEDNETDKSINASAVYTEYKPKTETWTFTLDDGTTLTKAVMVDV